MRFLVTARNFDSIVQPDDVQRMRDMIKQRTAELLDSGKVIESGVYADGRGGFFLLEADSPDELASLFFPLQDTAHMDVHPVFSFDKLYSILEEAENNQ